MELFWTLLSIILVISPEGKDSQKLTLERVRSNFIGSIVGLLCFLIHATNIYVLLLGIVATIVICYLFKVMNMSRVAIVAFLIVMLQSHTLEQSIAPIFRFLTVAFGCFIGLSITVSTSIVIQKLRKHYNI
ncbi:FUSC family protein [Flavobacterium sp. CBA20B-1]|nr:MULTISPECIES: FUSC family protein [unclassified Flavobacterium]WCM42888.1 FUSC family protein [Flavobacterium sp. CBA20B-1]